MVLIYREPLEVAESYVQRDDAPIPIALGIWERYNRAAILNATVPLGVIVIAPMFLPDERITAARVAGLAVGFAGVILLVAPDLMNLQDADLTGELMMLGSSLA